jgi:hypothetical protein
MVYSNSLNMGNNMLPPFILNNLKQSLQAETVVTLVQHVNRHAEQYIKKMMLETEDKKYQGPKGPSSF